MKIGGTPDYYCSRFLINNVSNTTVSDNGYLKQGMIEKDIDTARLYRTSLHRIVPIPVCHYAVHIMLKLGFTCFMFKGLKWPQKNISLLRILKSRCNAREDSNIYISGPTPKRSHIFIPAAKSHTVRARFPFFSGLVRATIHFQTTKTMQDERVKNFLLSLSSGMRK